MISGQGASYEGLFVQEKADGQGKLSIAGGMSYEGGFK